MGDSDISRCRCSSRAEWCAAVWSSAVELKAVPFYSVVQKTLREDARGPQLHKVTRFVFTINSFLVKRGPDLDAMHFPRCVWRGAWLPHAEVLDFAKMLESKQIYRVPMALAASQDESLAKRFLGMFAQNPEEKYPVLFVIHFHPVEKCTQVNFLESVTTCQGEFEWLFAAYSTFQVKATHAPGDEAVVDVRNPIKIEIEALPDNRDASEILKLKMWH